MPPPRGFPLISGLRREAFRRLAALALLLPAGACREAPPEPLILSTTPGIESSLLVDLAFADLHEIVSLVADTDEGGVFVADSKQGLYLDAQWDLRLMIRFPGYVHRPVLVPAASTLGAGRIADLDGSWDTVGLYGRNGAPLWVVDSDSLGGAPNVMTTIPARDGGLEFWIGLNGGGGLHRLDEEGRELARFPGSNLGQLVTLRRGTESVVVAGDRDGTRWFDAAGQPTAGFEVGDYGVSACDWPTLPGRTCLLTRDARNFVILSDAGEVVARLPVGTIVGTDHLGAAFQARDGRWGFALTAAGGSTSIVDVYDLDGTLLHEERYPIGQISGVLPLPLADGGGFAFGIGTVIRRIQWTGSTR